MKVSRVSAILLFVILAVMAPGLLAKETIDAALTPEQLAAIQDSGKDHEYQADQNALMGLLTHALYKDREIFLREVISNAADALTKIRYASLTDADILGETPELEIRVSFDADAGTLTITDTGVGMTGAGMEEHLGTIAKSGTKEFVQAATDAENASSLIGQFGVGFYSVYLVADEVTVVSKNNDDATQHIWFSNSDSQFKIAEDPRGVTLGRGTSIVLKLKENAAEFLDQERLEGLIQRYSAFIDYPIFLHASKEIEEEVVVPVEDDDSTPEDPDADMDIVDDGEDVEGEDVDAADAGDDEPKTKVEKVKTTVWEWKLVNEVKPVWTRPTSDITDEEYVEFFRALVDDDKANPLTHTHFNAEGDVNFKSVLYFPEEQDQRIFMSAEPLRNIKLFVRRVFITDDFQEILPRYFGFVQGIVDSDDLPLNVGRDELQQSRLLRVIRRKLVRKVIAMIKKISTDEEKYEDFWAKFGTNVKLGVIEDQANKLRLAKLLRFPTSVAGTEVETEVEVEPEVTEEEGGEEAEEAEPTTTTVTTTLPSITSLDDYISRAKSHQTQIYYLAGHDRAQLAASPFVERLLRAGYEVLFCDDPVDEYVMQSLREYEGFTIQDVSRDGVKIADGDAADELDALDASTLKDLGAFLKDTLVGKVSKVKVSRRLTTSPAALSTGSYGASANMERILKAQAFAADGSDPSIKVTKVLEINDKHPIIHALAAKVEANPEDQEAKDLAELLYETSVLTSGFALEDPAGFATRIHRFLKLSLDVDVDAEAEIVDYVEDEEGPEDDSLDYEEEDLDGEDILGEDGGDEDEEL